MLGKWDEDCRVEGGYWPEMWINFSLLILLRTSGTVTKLLALVYYDPCRFGANHLTYQMIRCLRKGHWEITTSQKVRNPHYHSILNCFNISQKSSTLFSMVSWQRRVKKRNEFSGYMIKVFQKVLLSETDWEVLLHTFVVERHAPLVIKKKLERKHINEGYLLIIKLRLFFVISKMSTLFCLRSWLTNELTYVGITLFL